MPDVADQPKSSKSRPRRSQAYSQALDIENSLHKTIIDPNTQAASRASCAAAWTRVQEAKRILRGKPLPGQLRPDLEQKRNARRKPQVATLLSSLPSDAPPQEAG